MATTESKGIVRARDGRSTRDAIVAAATRLMHVNGYQNTSLDDVLKESGVGKGNFYYHFKSKEELGHAILDELIESFLVGTLDPCFADPAGRPLDQIRCFLGRVVEMQRRSNGVGGCPLGNLAAEVSDVHEGFRSKLEAVFRAWRDRLTRAFSLAKSRGDVTGACDPAAAASFLVAALEGAILLTKVTKDIGVMERCVAELERYLSVYEAIRA